MNIHLIFHKHVGAWTNRHPARSFRFMNVPNMRAESSRKREVGRRNFPDAVPVHRVDKLLNKSGVSICL